mmetsp:Transcript_20048/g.50576  ORF Transcript_20048/g.50576 Transcript_20048/m.50576 type:complete len:1602 (+) Transcript_20048:247-5052(+)
MHTTSSVAKMKLTVVAALVVACSYLPKAIARTCPSKTYGPQDLIDADCTEIEGQLRFIGIYGLKEIQMPRLTRVRGGVFIEDNPDLESVYLPLLARVDHRLERSIIIRNNGLGYILTTTPPPQVYRERPTTTPPPPAAQYCLYTYQSSAHCDTGGTDGSIGNVGVLTIGGGSSCAFPSASYSCSASGCLDITSTRPAVKWRYDGSNLLMDVPMDEEGVRETGRTSTGCVGPVVAGGLTVNGACGSGAHSQWYKIVSNACPTPDNVVSAGARNLMEENNAEVSRSTSTTATATAGVAAPLAEDIDHGVGESETDVSAAAAALRVLTSSQGLTTATQPLGQYRPSTRQWLRSSNPVPFSVNIPLLQRVSNNIEITNNGKVRYVAMAYEQGLRHPPLMNFYSAAQNLGGQVDYVRVGEYDGDGNVLTVQTSIITEPGGAVAYVESTQTALTTQATFVATSAPDETTTAAPTTTTTTMSGALIGKTANDRTSLIVKENADLEFLNVGGVLKGQVHVFNNLRLKSIAMNALTEVQEQILVYENPMLNALDFPLLNFLGATGDDSMQILDNGLAMTYGGHMNFPALQFTTGKVTIARNRWFSWIKFPSMLGAGTEQKVNRRELAGFQSRGAHSSKSRKSRRAKEQEEKRNGENSRAAGMHDLDAPASWGQPIPDPLWPPDWRDAEEGPDAAGADEDVLLESSGSHAAEERLPSDERSTSAFPHSPFSPTGPRGRPHKRSTQAGASITVTLLLLDNVKLYYFEWSGIVAGAVDINSNADLLNVDAPQLRSVRGRFFIENNSSLQRLSFNKLEYLGDSGSYSLKFANNGFGALTRTGVFRCAALQRISRGMVFADNKNFEAILFPQMQTVGETEGTSVFVQTNNDLTQLDVNGAMEGNVVIHDNPDLESLRFEGLEKIKNDAHFYLTNNQLLHTARLVQLQEVTGDVIIGRNGQLARVHGMVEAPVLERVGGRIRVEQNTNIGDLKFPRLAAIGGSPRGEGIGIFQNINFACWHIHFDVLRSVSGYVRLQDNFMLDQMYFLSMPMCGVAQAELGSYCSTARFVCSGNEVRYPPLDSGIPSLKLLSPLEVTLESDISTNQQMMAIPMLAEQLEGVYAQFLQTAPIQVKIENYAITNPALRVGALFGGGSGDAGSSGGGGDLATSSGGNSTRALRVFTAADGSEREVEFFLPGAGQAAVWSTRTDTVTGEVSVDAAERGRKNGRGLEARLFQNKQNNHVPRAGTPAPKRKLGLVKRLLDVELKVIQTNSVDLQRVFNRIAAFSPSTFADMGSALVIEMAGFSNTITFQSVGRINVTSSFGLEGITAPPIPEGSYINPGDFLGSGGVGGGGSGADTLATPRPPTTENVGVAEKTVDYTWFFVVGALVLFCVITGRVFVYFSMQAALKASLQQQESDAQDRQDQEVYAQEMVERNLAAEKSKQQMLAFGSPHVMNNDFVRDQKLDETMGPPLDGHGFSLEVQQGTPVRGGGVAPSGGQQLMITTGHSQFDAIPDSPAGNNQLMLTNGSFSSQMTPTSKTTFRSPDGRRVAPTDYGDGIALAPGALPQRRVVGGKLKVSHKKKTHRGNPEAYSDFLRDRLAGGESYADYSGGGV